jgi:aspartyl-tRNA(Asn)/glutamyl-tRNA(Gln) amidotransferase subunit A
VRAGVIAQTVAGPGLAPGVAAAFRRAVDHLVSLGAEVDEVSLPSFGSALPAYYVIATAEASSNLARFDGLRLPRPAGAPPASAAPDVRAAMAAARAAGFPDEVKRRILMGTYVLSAGYVDAYYARAQRVRTLIQREMGGALRSGRALGGGGSGNGRGAYDVLLAPAAPTTAYPLGAAAADPLAMYLGDVMTVPLNLAGLPGVCVPAGFDDGGGGGGGPGGSDDAPPLPVGLQVIAGAWGEDAAVRVAHAFEVTAPWARRGWAPLAAQH